MSVLTDYFAAGPDGVAATAVDYVDWQPGLLDLTPEDVAAGKALYRVSTGEAMRPKVEVAQSGHSSCRARGATRLSWRGWERFSLAGRTTR